GRAAQRTVGSLLMGATQTAAGRRAVSIPSSIADMLARQLGRTEVVRSVLMFPLPFGELDGLRFHDLRHTAVALAIGLGAHPKAIQERMGHSSVMVTLDRYGHLFEGLDERIADGLDDVYRNACALVMWSPCGPDVVPAPPV